VRSWDFNILARAPDEARSFLLRTGMPEWYVEDLLALYRFYNAGAGAAEDENKFYAIEFYEDSDAVLDLRRCDEVSSGALAPFGAKFYPFWAVFSRYGN
jgi:hypothetical protein